MTADELRAKQAPWKAKYKDNSASALQTLTAEGSLDGGQLVCSVGSFLGKVPAGLHPSTGGDGSHACSADMLLQALIGCAGVTLQAVATAMGIPLRGGVVRAEGDLDFRGTLGVNKEAPVGFTTIRLSFELDADATPEQVETLMKLTRRYCVVYQTLLKSPAITETCAVRSGT
ncbi:MAG: OsmC family protein [Gemmataceae bacterium]|nr:OsmC family protein [Gemmataceae bacterium]